MSNKKILSGNEAVAYSAYVNGINVLSSYPGTPSTEIPEIIGKKFPEIYAEWSVNEKVGTEVAVGASIAGARSMTTFKHVGFNVAMDPFMTFAYVGANGAMIMCSCDDPGMHSSQNEQDNRSLAKFAGVPMFEPADSQEAFDMFGEAIKVSELFHIPVVFRMTTRVCHSSSVVDLREFKRVEKKHSYEKDVKKNCPIPAFARLQKVEHTKKMAEMKAYSDQSPLNFVEKGDKIGIVTSGITYQYVKETMPQASVLKLGMTCPIPAKKIKAFAASVDKLYVAEEGDPYLEEQIKALGIEVSQSKVSLKIGELNPNRLSDFANDIYGKPVSPALKPLGGLPGRPPSLCPGCSHRPVFYALNKLGCMVAGDIGCYSLGLMAPLNSIDSIICMGGGISNSYGYERAGTIDKPIVGFVGDSTFFHSGITGLVNMVYNKSKGTIIVSDNRITAMTGHQDNPGSGKTLMGETTEEVSIEAICKAIGVKRVRTIDPYNIDETVNAIKEEIAADELSVIIAKHPCMIGGKIKTVRRFKVDADKCKACGQCFKLGCTAIERGDCVDEAKGRYKSRINPILCVGCGMCSQLCKFGAIVEK
ncbi:MAG: indolepyruvate ferredoxin oxidoreductase subunit alpha [Abditibacteriota bacterium]|nr:indolepyruvate ferredoxin oxidoreductase subunit alpha [Abditibacteriota bacterium]